MVAALPAPEGGTAHTAKATVGAPRVVVPISVALLDDQLTPVLAYRRLVAPDQRTAPSFLLESVEGGERQGRYSILSAQPRLEVVVKESRARVIVHRADGDSATPGVGPTASESVATDPFEPARRLTEHLTLAHHRRPDLPACFVGGWVGFAAYDTVRYAEPGKLPFSAAPKDDRNLPDLHLAYYDGVVVFDHVRKLVHAITLVEFDPGAGEAEIARAYNDARDRLLSRVAMLQGNDGHDSSGGARARVLASGRMDLADMSRPPDPAKLRSNLTRQTHASMVERAKRYIAAGDIFQVVVGQRFERTSAADPFDVYRALRAVNPSPYMAYLQAQGCILIASSPEILCRVRREAEPVAGANPSGTAGTGDGPAGGAASRRVLTNRPLAGTRRRGRTPEEDAALEKELLADPKERAEHIMLADLGRNDVGHVCKPASVRLQSVMNVERYSHVMHISSTVTGELRDELSCWDALRSTLPVGTISGAPKVRAMQIIDELEPVRRGPYGGGLGYVSLDGDMDIALALRTIVAPTAAFVPDAPGSSTGQWTYHLQSAGGIVADSDPEAEYQETVNKAAALARAIDAAESAFGHDRRGV